MFQAEVTFVELCSKPEKVLFKGVVNNFNKRLFTERLLKQIDDHETFVITQKDLREMVGYIFTKMNDDLRAKDEKAFTLYRVNNDKKRLTMNVRLIPCE